MIFSIFSLRRAACCPQSFREGFRIFRIRRRTGWEVSVRRVLTLDAQNLAHADTFQRGKHIITTASVQRSIADTQAPERFFAVHDVLIPPQSFSLQRREVCFLNIFFQKRYRTLFLRLCQVLWHTFPKGWFRFHILFNQRRLAVINLVSKMVVNLVAVIFFGIVTCGDHNAAIQPELPYRERYDRNRCRLREEIAADPAPRELLRDTVRIFP